MKMAVTPGASAPGWAFWVAVLLVGGSAPGRAVGGIVDCNGNGIADEIDVAVGTSTDRNENGVPDECDLGACCQTSFPHCSETTELDCNAALGTWFLDAPCQYAPCHFGSCCEEGAGGAYSCRDSLEFECWGPSAAFDIEHLCATRVCDEPAHIALRAVGVNRESIVPSSVVVVRPGDFVEVEVYVSNWGPQSSGLKIWQMTMGNDAFQYSGDDGRIVARSPDINAGFCEDTGAPCSNSATCARCQGGPNDGVGCLTEFNCGGFECHYAACVTGVQNGIYIATKICSAVSLFPGRACQLDADCPEGACVVRSDFVFADREQRICAVASFLEFRAGCTLAGGASAALPDGGLDYYAVTAEYDVSPDALGEFTLAVRSAPGSFLADAGFEDAIVTVEPLVITVEPGPATGACCDCSELDSNLIPIPICTDGLSHAQCQSGLQVWTGGRTCAEAGCACEYEPIPAISEWGAMVLVLSLLIMAKVVFGTRRQTVAAGGF